MAIYVGGELTPLSTKGILGDAKTIIDRKHGEKSQEDINGEKQDVIQDLATIRSGAAAGATAQQPATSLAGYGITDAYTKTQADSLLASKQNNISDLNAIRTGAAAGITAYQKPNTGIPDTDLSDGVQTSLAKADTAQQPATTLSGYGITDAYTKIEGNSFENQIDSRLDLQDYAISLLNGNNVIVVPDHTQVQNPSTHDIYREPEAVTAPAVPSYYVDWMYYNNAWAAIGKYSFPGVESTPTENSELLVKSGGVYRFVTDKIPTINSQYIFAVMDDDGNIILAVDRTGRLVCDESFLPNALNIILDALKNTDTALSERISTIETKTDSLKITSTATYVFAITDAADSVLFGIKKNGEIYAEGFNLPNNLVENVEKSKEILDDVYGKAVIEKSQYVNEEEDTQKLSIIAPKPIAESYTVKNVSTEQELDNAIKYYLGRDENGNPIPNWTSENVYIKVNSDIILRNGLIEIGSGYGGSNKELIIDGQDNKITYTSDAKITSSGIAKGMSYVNREFPSAYYEREFSPEDYADANKPQIFKKYITEDGKVLEYSKTNYHYAASRVTYPDGTVPGSGIRDVFEQGTVKFMLPEELQDLDIQEVTPNNSVLDRNIFIEMSVAWTTHIGKVLYTKRELVGGEEKNFIYFYFDGKDADGATMSVNLDLTYIYGTWHQKNIYTSFRLWNLEPQDNCVFWEPTDISGNGRLYFPQKYSGIYESTDATYIKVHGNNGNIFIKNFKFIGGSGCCITAFAGANIIVSDCYFNSFRSDCIRTTGIPNNEVCVYVTNCSFENNASRSVVGYEYTTMLVDNCVFRNCGTSKITGTVGSIAKAAICNNTFINYHRTAITTGYGAGTDAYMIEALIENNVLYYTDEFLNNAEHLGSMDSGAIYINGCCGSTYGGRTGYTVIRHNRVNTYVGRMDNRGIYCDDGAYNFKIYGNVVDSTPNDDAIEARYATTHSASTPYNTNRIIAQNVVCGGIMLKGHPTPNNGCYLGANIFTSYPIPLLVGDLQVPEDNQIYSSNIKIVNGRVQSSVSLSEWNINQ